jgi:hypothetical protein
MFKKGTHIVAIHVKSGRLMFYKVVQDMTNKKYRLLNLKSDNIMAFKETNNPEDFREYIIDILKCEIVKVSE